MTPWATGCEDATPGSSGAPLRKTKFRQGVGDKSQVKTIPIFLYPCSFALICLSRPRKLLKARQGDPIYSPSATIIAPHLVLLPLHFCLSPLPSAAVAF